MRFALLGPMTVYDEAVGRELTPRGVRLRALLAALLLHANVPVPADVLTDAVWDGEPSPAALRTLRSYVRRLRAALGPGGRERIVARDPGYLVRLRECELDVLAFDRLCWDASAALRGADWDRASSAASEALGLWRGTPLMDVRSQLLRDEAVPRLEQLRLQALEDRVEADLHLGRQEQLIPLLRELTAQHPLRERFHAQRMIALCRCGRQAEALAAYLDARRSLVEELGIEPGPELRRLHNEVLAGDVDLVARLPAGAGSDTGSAASRVPHQLPAAPGHFTGRHLELEALLNLPPAQDSPAWRGGTVVVSAIDGMAGVGKTALAVHAAHRLSAEFPDGQLFIDLHGYTQGCEPRPPGAALEALLRSLGAAPAQIPDDIEQRAALYRHRLADARTLILLDNAANEAQVRPLLPGSAGCLVIITSRRRLKGLDDAYPLSLDVLPATEAVALLRAVAGPDRLPVDAVSTEIADLCGRLPLALRIAAALLRHRRSWTPQHLAGLLRDQQQRVRALDDGDRNLAAAFDLSYHSLDEQHRTAFRRLGLVPGPHLDAYAMAALMAVDPHAATRQLESLVDHNLLIVEAPGRYRLHDLIRLHANALAAEESGADRRAALDRLADYYQHTAGQADRRVARYPRPAPTGPSPAHAPALPDATAAWSWLRAERPNLLAVLRHADAQRDHERVVGLTAGLATLLRTDGPWTTAITIHAAAAQAAQRIGDRRSQARALTDLGALRVFTGDYTRAVGDQQQALLIFQDLADRSGQATALTELGRLRLATGDPAGATRELRHALDLFRDLAEADGQATALTMLGQARRCTGDYAGAAHDQQEALRLFRDSGNRYGQASALTWLADTRRATGDHASAVRDLHEALGLFRNLDDQNGQAFALTWLGDARRAAGDQQGAARDLAEALELFRRLGERNGHAIALTWLGAVRRSSGDLAGAVHDLETALDLFRHLGARNNEVVALNQYAATIAAVGDQPRALKLYRQTLDLARELGKRDEQALALEGIGQCHLRAGDRENAVAHLEQARDIFATLAMTPDTDRVQAHLTRAVVTEPLPGRGPTVGGVAGERPATDLRVSEFG